MLHVQVVVRGVSSADEDYLGRLVDGLEASGAEGIAVCFYPEDNEMGMAFDIEEDKLGGLAQPEGGRRAA